MARIKIKDLPKDKKISKEDMKKIVGGMVLTKIALTNTDLQNCLQNQQQSVQLLSNVSNVLNDTSSSVIRKTG